MVEVRKNGLIGELKFSNGETVRRIKRNVVFSALKEEKEKIKNPEVKAEFEIVISSLPGIKAIFFQKNKCLEIYYADEAFWSKRPECIISDNERLYRILSKCK